MLRRRPALVARCRGSSSSSRLRWQRRHRCVSPGHCRRRTSSSRSALAAAASSVAQAAAREPRPALQLPSAARRTPRRHTPPASLLPSASSWSRCAACTRSSDSYSAVSTARRRRASSSAAVTSRSRRRRASASVSTALRWPMACGASSVHARVPREAASAGRHACGGSDADVHLQLRSLDAAAGSRQRLHNRMHGRREVVDACGAQAAAAGGKAVQESGVGASGHACARACASAARQADSRETKARASFSSSSVAVNLSVSSTRMRPAASKPMAGRGAAMVPPILGSAGTSSAGAPCVRTAVGRV